MLKGRLGLETARVPQADRHGLLWLGRGKLYVESGCLSFVTAGGEDLEAGVYHIPFQGISNILMAPGTTVTHDALRLLARHQTGLVVVGEGGVRCYASMPAGPDSSSLARQQVKLWGDPQSRILVARRMYGLRMGQDLTPATDLNALRGVEGHRMKQIYKNLANQFGIPWSGRRYDRLAPEAADEINRSINHAATAVQAGAMIAVAVTGTIGQLGFIHEASGRAFALDIADLFRSSFTLPVAFEAVGQQRRQSWIPLERITRKLVGTRMQQDKIIPQMIDSIKEVLEDPPDGDNNRGDT